MNVKTRNNDDSPQIIQHTKTKGSKAKLSGIYEYMLTNRSSILERGRSSLLSRHSSHYRFGFVWPCLVFILLVGLAVLVSYLKRDLVSASTAFSSSAPQQHSTFIRNDEYSYSAHHAFCKEACPDAGFCDCKVVDDYDGADDEGCITAPCLVGCDMAWHTSSSIAATTTPMTNNDTRAEDADAEEEKNSTNGMNYASDLAMCHERCTHASIVSSNHSMAVSENHCRFDLRLVLDGESAAFTEANNQTTNMTTPHWRNDVLKQCTNSSSGPDDDGSSENNNSTITYCGCPYDPDLGDGDGQCERKACFAGCELAANNINNVVYWDNNNRTITFVPSGRPVIINNSTDMPSVMPSRSYYPTDASASLQPSISKTSDDRPSIRPSSTPTSEPSVAPPSMPLSSKDPTMRPSAPRPDNNPSVTSPTSSKQPSALPSNAPSGPHSQGQTQTPSDAEEGDPLLFFNDGTVIPEGATLCDAFVMSEEGIGESCYSCRTCLLDEECDWTTPEPEMCHTLFTGEMTGPSEKWMACLASNGVTEVLHDAEGGTSASHGFDNWGSCAVKCEKQCLDDDSLAYLEDPRRKECTSTDMSMRSEENEQCHDCRICLQKKCHDTGDWVDSRHWCSFLLRGERMGTTEQWLACLESDGSSNTLASPEAGNTLIEENGGNRDTWGACARQCDATCQKQLVVRTDTENPICTSAYMAMDSLDLGQKCFPCRQCLRRQCGAWRDLCKRMLEGLEIGTEAEWMQCLQHCGGGLTTRRRNLAIDDSGEEERSVWCDCARKCDDRCHHAFV
jgi:hypothetical protein